MSGLQRLESRGLAVGPELGRGMGRVRHPGQHHIPRLHRDQDGGGSLRPVPGTGRRLAETEHARTVEPTG